MADSWIPKKKKQLRLACLYQEKHSHMTKKWLTCESKKKLSRTSKKEWLTCAYQEKNLHIKTKNG